MTKPCTVQRPGVFHRHFLLSAEGKLVGVVNQHPTPAPAHIPARPGPGPAGPARLAARRLDHGNVGVDAVRRERRAALVLEAAVEQLQLGALAPEGPAGQRRRRHE